MIYRVPEATVRPGDIVQLAPVSQATKEHLHVGREETGKGGRRGQLLSPADLPAKIASGQERSRLVVPGLLSWAVLMTRGCDIDSSAQRQLAVLRPLAAFTDDTVKVAIIDGRHTSLHYLPEAAVGGAVLFPDSVIDFRFMVTLHKVLFEQLVRPVSLTRAAVQDMYLSWIKHTTGKLAAEVPCPTCGKPVAVFQAIEATANPPDDY